MLILAAGWVDETGESVWAEETNDAEEPFLEDSAWDQRCMLSKMSETFIMSLAIRAISRATGDSRWVT